MTGSDKGLNRIETILTGGNVDLLAHVLIVPFMELKRVNSTPAIVLSKS